MKKPPLSRKFGNWEAATWEGLIRDLPYDETFEVHQVAEMLNVSSSTVWHRIRDGKLHVDRPASGIIYVTSKALRDYAKRRMKGRAKKVLTT